MKKIIFTFTLALNSVAVCMQQTGSKNVQCNNGVINYTINIVNGTLHLTLPSEQTVTISGENLRIQTSNQPYSSHYPLRPTLYTKSPINLNPKKLTALYFARKKRAHKS